MQSSFVQCKCGAVEVQINGDPLAQYYCHCDDCQTVHGNAYAVSLHKAAAVIIVRGETVDFVLRTTPRTKCSRCETFLFAEAPGYDVRGLNGELLPSGKFKPQFHLQCGFASQPIVDDLPHFKGLPSEFGGSGELMER